MLREVDSEIIRLLLENRADPNEAPKGCDRPICLASDPKSAEHLLRHGANPNVTDSRGKTPLQQARKFKLIEL